MSKDLSGVEIILAELRAFRKENTGAHETLWKALDKQNGRVRKLEQWRTYIMGGLSLLVLIFGPALGWILWKGT